MKKFFYVLLSVLLLTSMISTQGIAVEDEGHDVDLWNAVKPLDTTVTFLNTGAHPDDERSDLLAYLSRGLGVKTASLIANRGEGGQNEIGNELGDALGIIRSNEMIEASKITGVKAYHLSEETSDDIYDFGFSKSPEETLEKWGEEVTYERLIRLIRTYQPDIVMPSFRDVPTQHGHHRAITILSLQAFEDAADPTIFPEQIENEGLKPFQSKKLYLPASEEQATTSIEIGDYDPIYGMTYPQLGEESRYMHKSQGMGNDIPAEPRQFHLELVKSVEDMDNDSLFKGVPYDFNEWANELSNEEIVQELQSLQSNLDHIIELYPDREAILPKSQQALKQNRNLLDLVKKSNLEETIKNDLIHKLELKEEQLQEVSYVSSSLDVEQSIDSNVLTQGEETTVNLTLTNNGNKKLHHVNVSLLSPKGWEHQDEVSLKHLKPNESKVVSFDVKVPKDAEHFNPYEESILQSNITFNENGTETTKVLEFDNTVSVLPDVSVNPSPSNLTINTADQPEQVDVTVLVRNYVNGQNEANVSLNLPEGWDSTPSTQKVAFSERFEEKELTFQVDLPENVDEGNFNITALAESNGKLFNETVQTISYEHIKDSYYIYPAKVNGVSFELLKPDHLKIGYVESGFDEIADHLINTGFDVTKLDTADLENGDLSQYDTIVTGIRANLSRDELLQNYDHLMEYVENGGHLVAQYHKPWDNWDPNTSAPYYLEIGQPSIEWRVTDEDADVTMTQPDHKVFNYPNNITDADWDNWVQERGLYFPMNWSNQYETLVSMADPGEEPFDGGILVTDYGEGTYIYTNLVFYRQLNNQVPGGYRIFTNLLYYGHE
ncbi:NEW3 domain-containing protein [Piscibacillus halophilus]|uniref:GlcNAc-PI de-N-acetylase n=1 Tax=Piscibacillus halophilus TaxID=571933 RepID=A0A1H9HQG2_9BACI|nr:NEW3 domain-containing protein [Piscibacillus halophilus]SEQ64561.1 GlcNAc-PI de-N-acetylase [Piscibacillus halophilus]